MKPVLSDWHGYPTRINLTTLSHQQVGQATISFWNIGTSSEIDKDDLREEFEIKRGIEDCMDSTRSDIEVTPTTVTKQVL